LFVNRMKKLTDHLSRVSSTTLPAIRVALYRTLNNKRCRDKIRMLPSLAVGLRRSVPLVAKKQLVYVSFNLF